jgi:hypothetical protein
MKLKPLRIAVRLLLLLAGLPVSAQTAGEADARLRRGMEAHNQASVGTPGALARALELLGPEGWTRPPRALAYHGSAVTLQARDANAAGKLMQALAFIEAGAKEIDEAVRLEPGNMEIRILRLENSLALLEGSPVDRSGAADEDIAILAARASDLAPETAAILELDRGRLSLHRRRLNEALGFWRAAVRAAPESDAARRARALLARYGD